MPVNSWQPPLAPAAGTVFWGRGGASARARSHCSIPTLPLFTTTSPQPSHQALSAQLILGLDLTAPAPSPPPPRPVTAMPVCHSSACPLPDSRCSRCSRCCRCSRWAAAPAGLLLPLGCCSRWRSSSPGALTRSPLTSPSLTAAPRPAPAAPAASTVRPAPGASRRPRCRPAACKASRCWRAAPRWRYGQPGGEGKERYGGAALR